MSSISSDHGFAVNHDMHYTQHAFATWDKADSSRQRQSPASKLVQMHPHDNPAIIRPSNVKRLHRRHKSSCHPDSPQILDLVPASLPGLPVQASDSIHHRYEADPHLHMDRKEELLGRHMSQLHSAVDKQTLHKRHQSLVARQRSLRSSNPLVSSTLLVAMQDIKPVPSPDTRIYVHDVHDDLSLEKDTTLPVAQSSYPTRRSLAFWLILYFFFNLGLTLYNKGILIRFPFPYTLTALHALCGTFGGLILLRNGVFVPAKLSDADNLVLVAFSVLYTINIAVSNISLQLVTIPFHQVVRAASPIFTILLSMFLFGTRSSNLKMASLVPVMGGVGFATYGDYSYTTAGLVLTVIGTVLAAIKTIYTSILQSTPSSASPKPRVNYIVPPRLQLHPLDLLTRMAPLAFIQCIILAHLSGEFARVRTWSSHEMTPVKATVLGMNGIIAFGLNVVSFSANRAVGPLSMTVAANVKQVLSILLAVIIFDLTITPTNAVGILLTLVGGTWYAAVEYKEKRGRWR